MRARCRGAIESCRLGPRREGSQQVGGGGRRCAQQRHAGDGLQPTLLGGSGFQPRLMPSVRPRTPERELPLLIDVQTFGDELIEDLALLESEANSVYLGMVRPTWDVDTHRYPNTLHGLVMDCFAFLDLVSRYWKGSLPQTPRMLEFMDKYIAPRKEANDVALHMWRHTLMHTGKPRDLVDNRTGIRYNWLLHWSTEQLPETEHLRFQQPEPKRKTLNVALTVLIKDLRRAFAAYLVDLRTDTVLQHNLSVVYSEVELQQFQTRP